MLLYQLSYPGKRGTRWPSGEPPHGRFRVATPVAVRSHDSALFQTHEPVITRRTDFLPSPPSLIPAGTSPMGIRCVAWIPGLPGVNGARYRLRFPLATGSNKSAGARPKFSPGEASPLAACFFAHFPLPEAPRYLSNRPEGASRHATVTAAQLLVGALPMGLLEMPMSGLAIRC